MQDATLLDLEIGNNQIYVLNLKDDMNKYIDIYTWDYKLEHWGVISTSSVANFPGASDYDPTQIEIAPNKPGVLFIQSQTQIMVLGLANLQPIYLNVISIAPPLQTTANWTMVVTAGSVIAMYDGPMGYIQEYNLDDINFLKS
jgi:hypothetical protein